MTKMQWWMHKGIEIDTRQIIEAAKKDHPRLSIICREVALACRLYKDSK